MDFKKTSRRDDFESLFYMLIYMLNDQNLWVGDTQPLVGSKSISDVFAEYTWLRRRQRIKKSIA